MSIGAESLVIGVLVLGALLWAARSAYRAVKSTGGCSSCASSGECPLVENPEALEELALKGQSAPADPCPSSKAPCGELVDSLEEKKPV